MIICTSAIAHCRLKSAPFLILVPLVREVDMTIFSLRGQCRVRSRAVPILGAHDLSEHAGNPLHKRNHHAITSSSPAANKSERLSCGPSARNHEASGVSAKTLNRRVPMCGPSQDPAIADRRPFVDPAIV